MREKHQPTAQTRDDDVATVEVSDLEPLGRDLAPPGLHAIWGGVAFAVINVGVRLFFSFAVLQFKAADPRLAITVFAITAGTRTHAPSDPEKRNLSWCTRKHSARGLSGWTV